MLCLYIRRSADTVKENTVNERWSFAGEFIMTSTAKLRRPRDLFNFFYLNRSSCALSDLHHSVYEHNERWCKFTHKYDYLMTWIIDCLFYLN